MPRGELHIQLFVDYADDEKFEEVSRSSRLLYVDALCQAKALLNDGQFSRAKVRKLMYPETARAADKAAAELVTAGLWRWDETRQVYTIAAWLKRNKSRSQIEQDRRDAEEASLKANHKRWHLARNERDDKCRLCLEEPSGPRSGSGSGSGSGGGQRSESTETETETETETKNKEKPPVAPRSPKTPAPEPEPPDGDPGPAEQLVTNWMLGCNRRPPSKVVDAVGRHVAQMLRDGIDPDDIRRAINYWQDRGLNPSALPSVVNQLMNAKPSNVVAIGGRMTNRPSITDQRVAATLDLGAELQAEANRKALER